MVRYAEAECATCHALRPKNEMREVRIRRRSYSSYRSFWGLKGNGTRSFSSRDGYRHQRVFVCLTCKPPKSDGGIGTFSTLIWLGALGGGLIFVLPALLGGAAKIASGDTPTEISADTQSVVSEHNEGSDANFPASYNDGIEAAATDTTEAPEPFEFDVASIRGYELKAVETGEAQRWNVDGLAGITVASQPEATSNGVCKSVYSVLEVSGEESPVRTYCSSHEGIWSPRG